ncbi:unnamed protein product [Calypogeia fissa]
MATAFSHSSAVGRLPMHLPGVPEGVRFSIPRYNLEETRAVLKYYHSKKVTHKEPSEEDIKKLFYLTATLWHDELGQLRLGVLHNECAAVRVGSSFYQSGLTYGARRRLNIALELLTRPHLVYLDEPLTGLDRYVGTHR